MALKRIHIIGAPGSGKTYLGKKLAKYLSVPAYDLDNVYWANPMAIDGVERPVDERTKQLETILQKDSWILEGIYYKWLGESFQKADAIIILQSSDFIRNLRLVKRFLQVKLGLVDAKKERLKFFIALVKWGQTYAHEKMPPLLEMTEKYKDKRFFFKNADEAFNFLTNQE